MRMSVRNIYAIQGKTILFAAEPRKKHVPRPRKAIQKITVKLIGDSLETEC